MIMVLQATIVDNLMSWLVRFVVILALYEKTQCRVIFDMDWKEDALRPPFFGNLARKPMWTLHKSLVKILVIIQVLLGLLRYFLKGTFSGHLQSKIRGNVLQSLIIKICSYQISFWIFTLKYSSRGCQLITS